MKTKDVILELRMKRGLSQDELAEKLFVTRQAVSRWETGETTPNTETLKLLSKLFDVSINTLLGSPRTLICQCCGMPLEDSATSKEVGGAFNEDYCKYCYSDGEYRYDSMEDLIEVCVRNMSSETFPPEQVRTYMNDLLPKLKFWQRYEAIGGKERLDTFKAGLIEEINALNVDGLPQVEALHMRVGSALNFEHRLPSGEMVQFLDDSATYLCAELPCVFDESTHFFVIANADFISFYTRGEDDATPELLLYKKR